MVKDLKAMKKILVPCDFSDTAVHAFKLAVEIAANSKAEILVLHAMEFMPVYETAFVAQPYVSDPSGMEEMQHEAERNFEMMMAKCGDASLPINFVTDHGSVTNTIRKFIETQEADLVVMGTHGVNGLKEFLIGSNTEKIVRHSHVPVLSLKSPTRLSTIRNIVFPTLPDLNQVNFVAKLKELQHFLDAKLHILYVNTPIHLAPEKDIKRALEDYAQHYQFTNYTLNMVNDSTEENGIINFTHDIKADMIAMATHGRKALAHLLSGSIAEDVVNHVDCPIWTYTLKSS
jgi:nucleotide-binding universal stress UspA family protein